ncbi:hypothetical protein JC881_02190 [Variovorax sp. IB41]|nr:hypothetical protein [Variovorax sp. IB41]
MFDPKKSDEASVSDVNQPRNAKKPGTIEKKSPSRQRPPLSKRSLIYKELTTPAASATPSTPCKLDKLDKLELVLPRHAMTEHELQQAGARLKATGLVTKRTTKGEAYLLLYVLRCPSGTKIVFNLVANKADMRFCLKITLNPDHMTAEDTEAFLACVKHLFLLNGRAIVARLLLNRVDQAYDHPVSLADLVIRLPGSPTERKFFIATDRKGVPQSWYCGSIESPVHWNAYDQNASDDYKAERGEVVPRRRVRPEDDAEFLVKSGRRGANTRFEVRRVFDQPMSLRQADELARTTPFGIVDIYLVDDAKMKGAPPDFCLYLDSVKLHGVAGARSNFLARDKSPHRNKRLAAFEEHLAGCCAPFWNRSGLNSSIEDALSKLPVWKVLKYLVPTSSTTAAAIAPKPKR